MKARIMLTGLFFFFLLTGLMAQDEKEMKKASIGDLVYEEYQENGIDAALEKYEALEMENPDDYHWDEWELNRIGYDLMEEGDMEAAERVFRYNMEAYPEAANPYDSYADYLIEQGDIEQAKEYLQKSMAISENSDIEDEKTRIYRGSKAKLAKLENKGKDLDFLVGNWTVNSSSFEDEMETGKFSGVDEFEYDEDSMMLTVKHKNASGKTTAKRILVYDAINDEFDLAYINAEGPMGIRTSTIKMHETGDDTFEFIEDYETEEGEKKQIRHELRKNSDDQVEWVIFEPGENGEDWEKVYAMNMARNN